MRKRGFLFICLLACFALVAGFSNIGVANAAEVSPYSLNLYSSNNGVSTGEANVVLQTSDGFIWIGGYGGLQRFDGKNFVSFGESSGLTSNAIRALYESKDGTLWVGSNEQGAFYYKDGRFNKVTTSNSTHLSVRCFEEDNNGRMWLGSSNGLGYIDENYNFVSFELLFKNSNFNSTIYSLSLDSDGYLWGVDYSGTFFVINTKLDTPKIIRREYLPANYAYSLLVASDDSVYIGTNTNSVFVIERSTSEGSSNKNDLEVQYSLSTGGLSEINCICEAEDGTIWMCGSKGIGVIYDGDYYDYSFIDKTDRLVNITEDYEHNIWIASAKYGVLNIHRQKVSKLVNADSLNDVETHAIVKVSDGYYIGAENGLLVFDNDWEPVTNAITTELEGLGVNIRDILADGDLVYIATDKDGLYIYDKSSDTVTNIPSTTINATGGYAKLRVLYKLSNGKIMIGSGNGVSIIEGTTITEKYNMAIQILCITELNDGTILIGTDGNGIFKYTGSAVEKYADISNGLSGNVILRITEDDKAFGNMFVSCGNSVFYGNNGGFTQTAQITDGSGSVVDIVEDEDYVWLFRTSGIIRAKRDELINSASQMSNKMYISQDDGIPGSIVANSWGSFVDGKFIICTTNGIGVLDTKNIYVNTVKPKVALTGITMSDGEVWDGSTSVTLGKSLYKVTISFAALTYNGASVEYYLEGLDDKVITKNISDQTDVEYTNLKKGTYKFHLTVLNADGTRSDEMIITFIKKPMFVETGWFYVVIVLAVLIFASLVAFIIIRQSRRKQKFYKDVTDQSIATISGVIDAKDPYTNGHSMRVAEYAVKIAKHMGLKSKDCERLNYIALLHDIGKIGVPDRILNKPGRLTDEEFTEIKHHVDVGGEVLSNFTVLEGVTEGALYHHERYDGSGYGKGIKGEDIPLFARIIAVADSFDAMNSSRCYRPAMPMEKIKEELLKGRGTQFDPKIVDVAIEIIDEEQKQKSEQK